MKRRLSEYLHTYTGRLLLGILIINALLVSVLLHGLLRIVSEKYEGQFVSHARAQSYLMSALLDRAGGKEIPLIADELVLSGQVSYAEYVAANGSGFPSAHNSHNDRFQEDFAFGEHGDHTYYIEVAARSGNGGRLRIGFSEDKVEEEISHATYVGVSLATLFVVLTMAAVAYYGKVVNKSIRCLQEASRRIAEGGIGETMSIDSGLTEISSLAADLETMRQNLLQREQELAQREARQRAVLETAAEGIITVTPEGRIETFNKAAENLFGYRASQVIGSSFVQLLAPDQAGRFYTPTGEPAVCSGSEFAGRRATGATCQLLLSVSEALAADTRCFTIMVQDISERLAYEARLAHQATHDALTGLPNRTLYIDRLNQILATAARNDNIVGVFFLDLDRFKYINDSLGHHVGDELLQAAAKRLRNLLRADDTLARLGGDEFTIILPHMERATGAVAVAENIVKSLERPFTIAGKELFISCSIGIAFYPFDGSEAAELSKNADTAMYATKSLGGHGFQFYSKQMNAKAASRLELDTKLRYALERSELLLYYQPQVDCSSGRVVGVEALIRWQHPELGLVAPSDFIPLAEETGIIIPITEWVLTTACRQARVWQDEGMPISVGVNLSACHFLEPNLLDTVRSVLQQTGLKPQLLDLEMTESMVMEHGEETIKILQRLKQLGVTLSLDDFGTGYSSLSYLKRFPIDTLKIDRAFIQDISESTDDGTLATTIIAMARSLRMQVIAEGVESVAQLEYLRTYGSNRFQGFFFSRPLPADEITELLRRNHHPDQASEAQRSMA